MGPEGGSGGGQIVATGTPEEIAANPASHTGHWLAPVLKCHHTLKSEPAASGHYLTRSLLSRLVCCQVLSSLQCVRGLDLHVRLNPHSLPIDL